MNERIRTAVPDGTNDLLYEEIALLREALKEAEWGGSRWIGMATCPACSAEREEGHKAGCVVAVALWVSEQRGVSP